ncbi:MAG: carbon-nitrogen hydrolase family protein [Actinobacteria bacterium]|nr:carbon-nitrogen hydrolase family protein [Actinomycetota bacterium]
MIQVGGAQLATVLGDAAANLEKVERIARDTKARYPGLQLLAFPELALSGYDCGDAFRDLAQTWPTAPEFQRLSSLAKELETILVVGYAESTDQDDTLYDSAAVIDADGAFVGSYRKTHCLDRERPFFENGDDLPVYETTVGRLGVLICWDSAMPEAARVLALAGADILVVVAAWEDPYGPDWETVIQARAFENVIPVLGVNRTGTDVTSVFSGRSRLVDCWGRLVTYLDDEADGVLVGTVDLAETAVARSGEGSQLRDRRPDLYGSVVAPLPPA